MTSNDNLIWIDLEMTGLEPERHRIIEIATVVTDQQLRVLGEGPVLAVRQAQSELLAMDEWCTTTHTQSGLVKRVQESGCDEAAAEQQTLDFLQTLVPAGVSPMCGNSIGQDRRFLRRYMPRLEAYFHYRNLDVSTLKELAKRWLPAAAEAVAKESRHLALDDVYDSIAELKTYRELLFVEAAREAAIS